MNTKTKVKRIISIILIIVHCSIIFYFSNQEADDSTHQSSRVVEFISEILPSIKNMNEPDKTQLKKEVLTPIVRKTAHFSMYALLGIYTSFFILNFEKLDTKKKVLYSLLFCMLYATTDEIHQIFVPGRSGKITDILIDTSGSMLGIGFIIGGAKLWRKK